MTLAVVISTTGCVGPKITPRVRPNPNDAAHIAVFRRSEFLLSAAPAIVAIGDIESASLNQRSWAEIDVPPGSHILSVRSWGWGQPKSTHKFDILPGERIVFEATPNGFMWIGSLVPIAGFFIQPFVLQKYNDLSCPPYSNTLNQIQLKSI